MNVRIYGLVYNKGPPIVTLKPVQRNWRAQRQGVQGCVATA
jgi:hypothetical protein